jgi:hypothetical protein
VKGNCIASNDQTFNFLGVEDGQEFFEVGEHPRLVPSIGKLQERSLQPHSCGHTRAFPASPGIRRLSKRRSWRRCVSLCPCVRFVPRRRDASHLSARCPRNVQVWWRHWDTLPLASPLPQPHNKSRGGSCRARPPIPRPHTRGPIPLAQTESLRRSSGCDRSGAASGGRARGA